LKIGIAFHKKQAEISCLIEQWWLIFLIKNWIDLRAWFVKKSGSFLYNFTMEFTVEFTVEFFRKFHL
jgi:hypothetical protein